MLPFAFAESSKASFAEGRCAARNPSVGPYAWVGLYITAEDAGTTNPADAAFISAFDWNTCWSFFLANQPNGLNATCPYYSRTPPPSFVGFYITDAPGIIEYYGCQGGSSQLISGSATGDNSPIQTTANCGPTSGSQVQNGWRLFVVSYINYNSTTNIHGQQIGTGVANTIVSAQIMNIGVPFTYQLIELDTYYTGDRSGPPTAHLLSNGYCISGSMVPIPLPSGAGTAMNIVIMAVGCTLPAGGYYAASAVPEGPFQII